MKKYYEANENCIFVLDGKTIMAETAEAMKMLGCFIEGSNPKRMSSDSEWITFWETKNFQTSREGVEWGITVTFNTRKKAKKALYNKLRAICVK